MSKKEGTEYRPCKKCKSDKYDNADQKEWNYNENDELIVEPDECDSM